MKLKSGCISCFAGLSCQTRIGIISLLQKKKQMSVLDIASNFKVSQPTVTHHLKYLEEMEVLSSKKEGRKVFYFIHPKCKDDVCTIFS